MGLIRFASRECSLAKRRESLGLDQVKYPNNEKTIGRFGISIRLEQGSQHL